jgi:L-alanine-DL-glutamate epimerase-like enolase superfamily enzyme
MTSSFGREVPGDASVIERIETEVVRVPLHTPFVTSLRTTHLAETLVVRMTDSDGVTGWGEAPQVWKVTGDSIAGSKACLEGPLGEALLGAPVAHASAGLIQDAVAANNAAKMAADIALHDILARRAGVTMAEHLAGLVRPRTPPPLATTVTTDMTISLDEPEAMAAVARQRVADGFTTLKLKVGRDAELDLGESDIARVRAVRDAVGPGIALRIDANQGWDAATAIRVIDAVEDVGLEFVEQPVHRRHRAALAEVRANVHVPVMADEAVFDLYDLEDVVNFNTADAVNVKLAKCGGLTMAVRLVAVARHAGLRVMVGCMMESALGIGAAASLVAALSLDGAHDLDAGWWATASPYAGGVTYDGPTITLSTEPGLGITSREKT